MSTSQNVFNRSCDRPLLRRGSCPFVTFDDELLGNTWTQWVRKGRVLVDGEEVEVGYLMLKRRTLQLLLAVFDAIGDDLSPRIEELRTFVKPQRSIAGRGRDIAGSAESVARARCLHRYCIPSATDFGRHDVSSIQTYVDRVWLASRGRRRAELLRSSRVACLEPC